MHRDSAASSRSSAARALVRAAILLALLPWPFRSAGAQMFSYNPDPPRAVQSASFTYTAVSFRYAGDGTPSPSFAFEAPLYGATYTRPNFHVTFGYGRDERPGPTSGCEPDPCPPSVTDLRMLDASITTWGEVRIAGTPAGSRLFIPIAVHTGFRRVAPDGLEDSLVDAFNITVLGIGTGVGSALELGEGLRLEARATPMIGLALRAFGEAAGSSRLFDGHVQLHAPALIGRFGLSAAYGLRAQAWNVSASQLFPDTQDDLFDYTGMLHALSLGLNW